PTVPATSTTAPGPGPDSALTRLLLVEDDDIDSMAILRHVERSGLDYRVTVARSLAEAHQLLATETFDVLLTDLRLGDGEGLELIDRAPDLPIIVITGVGDEATASRALRAGAHDYLIKDIEGRYLTMVQPTVEAARRHHRSTHDAKVLSQALRALHDAVCLTDLSDRLTFVNRSFLRLYGMKSGEQALGMRSAELWPESSAPAADEPRPLQPAPANRLPTAGEAGDCLQRRRDGSTFNARISRSPVFDAQGERIGAVYAIRDTSARRRSEVRLRESEERYALAAEAAGDGLWDWDLRSGEVYYSKRWRRALGLDDATPLEPTLESWTSRVHADDLPLLQAGLDTHLAAGSPHLELEHRVRSADGTWRWMQVRGLAVRDADGRVTRFAGSMRDTTSRRRAEEQLSHAALHDALTELPNRALFMDRLDRALQRGGRCTVFFFDLDRFQRINDSLGHQVGDQLLRKIAHRLREAVGPVDTVARLSADEFVVLLDEPDPSRDLEADATRLLEIVGEPLELAGQRVYPSASLGVVVGGGLYRRAEEMLRDADIAMHQAKRQGRGRWARFEEGMGSRAVAALRTESDIRKALERDELELRYQPIVDLQAAQLAGFEALLRWNHPQRGLLSPADFLDVARDAGLIAPIGWWVLDEACRQAAAWERASGRPMEMAVNLDAEQLGASSLDARVEQSLDQAGLDPRRLRLEITESMLVRHPEQASRKLGRLREHGVRVDIDDFGTGYSSLAQ
ncbi:MAG: EAL domain-containing protein, partial [Acidobacteriota bacterium]